MIDKEPPSFPRGKSFFEKMNIRVSSGLPDSKDEKIAKLEDTLRFYTDPSSWEYRYTPTGEEVSNIGLDHGSRARKALL